MDVHKRRGKASWPLLTSPRFAIFWLMAVLSNLSPLAAFAQVRQTGAMSPHNHTGTKEEQRYRVEAVTRAVRLLRGMRENGPQDAAALAQATDTPPAFAAQALETLARHGLVRPLAEEWGLGLSWLKIADSRRRQTDLRELALPVMRRIRNEVDETVILCVRRGLRRINIDYVESTQAIRRVTQHGFEAPLHVGAAGRALLSHTSPDELGEYFAQATTSAARGAKLLDVAHYAQDLERVRELGFAVVSGEMTRDTVAVSAPVRDHTGAVVAALTISAPSDRVTEELQDACTRAVITAAQQLSELLGFGATHLSQNQE